MADYNVNELLCSQTYLLGEENSSLEHVEIPLWGSRVADILGLSMSKTFLLVFLTLQRLGFERSNRN